MSANLELEGIVAAPTAEPTAEAIDWPFADARRPASGTYLDYARLRRSRPAWLPMAAVGAAAIIAASSLGFVAYSGAQQRDMLYAHLVGTTATLAATQGSLTAAQADAAARKVTADYVALYIADGGRMDTEYESLVNCTSYSSCRTSAQQMLEDVQAFQADREAASIPSALSASDTVLGDSLSAALAADQELISGMDGNGVTKVDDGFKKLDAAMLNIAKAEASLGAALK